jgi:hypothetical protein
MVLSMAVAFPGRQIMMAFYFMLTKGRAPSLRRLKSSLTFLRLFLHTAPLLLSIYPFLQSPNAPTLPVYTNSLLGTLNVRDHLREASERAKWISTASFMFTRTRDIMGTTNNGPVRTTQGAHTVHELGDLKQDPVSWWF